MSKDTKLLILIAVTPMFLISLATIVMTGEDVENQEPEQKQETITIEDKRGEQTTSEQYSRQELRESFVDGCASTGGVYEETCQCMFDRLVDKYGFQEFVDKAIDAYRGGSFPADWEDEAMKCYYQRNAKKL